jgi:predicted dehydrogenase
MSGNGIARVGDPPNGRPVRLAILGLGNRGGKVYAGYAERHPDQARVVAVADPLPYRRDDIAARHRLPESGRFADFRDLTARLADPSPGQLSVDAVMVALPDADHVEAVRELAPHPVPILMEKPLASTPDSLRELEAVAADGQARIYVAHVLRYTPFFRTVHAVLRSGAIGETRTIRLEENIGYWHFAHSYVRGNWRRHDLASPMILAKSCHDLDALRWLADSPPRSVASVGSLAHFREENAPPGAPGHCLDGCPVADECPFYAPRFYADALAHTDDPPVALLGPDLSREGRLRALATGPYGRCVYRCDNDVADHQQVLVAFDNDLTATLTVSAFTSANTRTIQVTGTRGEILGRMDTGDLQVHLYDPTRHDVGEVPPEATLVHRGSAGPLSHDVLDFHVRYHVREEGLGHAGGDEALLDRFVGVLAGQAPPDVLETSLAASLDSHWMAFAAEESRHTGQTVHFP